MNETIKILVVDDEPKIVEVIESYLKNSGYSVYIAYSGKQALEIFQKTSISLIILDLMLPDISGEEICKIIRRDSKVPIIMLTAKVEEESILKGLDFGADDYVTKPFSPKQLVARVIAILRRSNFENKLVKNIISFNADELVVDTVNYEVIKGGIRANLTPNEYKILITMIKYPKKVFTRDELLIAALGEEYDGYDRTIDTHIKNLRQKIENSTKNPKYILTVHGIGYRFGGETYEI